MAKATARGELDIDIKRWQAGFARAGQSIKSIEKQAMRFGSLALFGTGLGIAAATKLLADFQSARPDKILTSSRRMPGS